ncbi:DUF4363 family protein [Virgibacillus halodenitrificans]|nr:DUF4363 family protein [Virgibacillus halodenitrificans]
MNNHTSKQKVENKLVKRIYFAVLILIILSGCSQITGKDVLLNNIKTLEMALDQKDWESAEEHTDELQRLYKGNRWKIQLLGDEGEYEKLYEGIQRLKVTIREEANPESKIELATVKSLIKDIYSL